MKSHTLGKVLGEQWKIEECIGAGGMGEVYRARDLKHLRAVAVKVLEHNDHSTDEIFDRFFLEAQVSRRLRHPNIIEIYDFGFDDEIGFYMVMELLVGCDLSEYLQTHPEDVSVADVWSIFGPVCDALVYTHEKNVVHRDLKPSNIFLLGGTHQQGHIKLLDFGIAKVASDLASHETSQGNILGTPRYLSPEQAQGNPVGPYSDIYTLANILFEVLTGSPLFKADSSFSWLYSHVELPPPLLRDVCPQRNYSLLLEELLQESLSKDPANRPPSMLQFRNRLHRGLLESPHPAEQVKEQGQVAARASEPRRKSPSEWSKTEGEMQESKKPKQGGRPVSSKPIFPTLAKHKPGVSSSSVPPTRSRKGSLPRSRPQPVRSTPEVQTPSPSKRGGWLSLLLFFLMLTGGGLYGLVKLRPKNPVSQKIVSLWSFSLQKVKKSIGTYKKPKAKRRRSRARRRRSRARRRRSRRRSRARRRRSD